MATAVRRMLGPTVRRARREVQWRRTRGLRLARTGPEGFAHPVATHATPLFRELAGVERRLQENKVVNLGLALGRLDGLVLAPGQRFSFWWHVGRPTARRGFLEAVVLDHGRVTEGTGGGLCQLTNLIYWMTLHTPLTVVERWRHSYDVFPDSGRSQPFGSGATCAYPVLDLQVENRTTTAFRLGLTVTATHLRGAWAATDPWPLRYEVYESDHVMTNDGPGVFTRHNVIRRRVSDPDGVEVADELVAANQALLMYQPFLEAGPGERSTEG